MKTETKLYIALAVFVALFVVLAVIASCQPRPAQPSILATPAAEIKPVGVAGNWNLVLQEEFDNTTLSSIWYLCPIWYSCSSGGGTDQGIKAQAWFLGSQITQPGDGYLHLRAEKLATAKYGSGDHNYAHPYSSGYAITGRQQAGWYQYGYFEARMKCPQMNGSWCAFWLWQDRSGISGIPYSSGSLEIDITETLGNAPTIHNMNLHGGPSFSRTYTMSSPNYNWHVYAVDWQLGYVKWYVDGVLTGTYTGTGFDGKYLYILATYQLGGTWAGTVEESKLPNDELWDYIRVWQSVSGPTSTTGPTNTTAPATLTRTPTATRTPTIPPPATLTRTPTLFPSVTPVPSLTPTLPAGYPTLAPGCWNISGGYICINP